MTIEIYLDADQKWRWRAVAKNGKVLADGGEGYARSANVRRAIRDLRADFVTCPVKRTEPGSIPEEPPLTWSEAHRGE